MNWNYRMNKSMGYDRFEMVEGARYLAYPDYNDVTDELKSMSKEEILTKYYIGDLIQVDGEEN